MRKCILNTGECFNPTRVLLKHAEPADIDPLLEASIPQGFC